jgi:hypothetical protein
MSAIERSPGSAKTMTPFLGAANHMSSDYNIAVEKQQLGSPISKLSQEREDVHVQNAMTILSVHQQRKATLAGYQYVYVAVR